MAYYTDLESAFHKTIEGLSGLESYHVEHELIHKLIDVLSDMVYNNPHAIACDPTTLSVALYVFKLIANAGGKPKIRKQVLNHTLKWNIPVDIDQSEWLDNQCVANIQFPSRHCPTLIERSMLFKGGFASDFPKLPVNQWPPFKSRFLAKDIVYSPYCHFQYLAGEAAQFYYKCKTDKSGTRTKLDLFKPFFDALTDFVKQNGADCLHSDIFVCRSALLATLIMSELLNAEDFPEHRHHIFLPLNMPSNRLSVIATTFLKPYPTEYQLVKEPTSSGFAIEFSVHSSPSGNFAPPAAKPVPPAPSLSPRNSPDPISNEMIVDPPQLETAQSDTEPAPAADPVTAMDVATSSTDLATTGGTAASVPAFTPIIPDSELTKAVPSSLTDPRLGPLSSSVLSPRTYYRSLIMNLPRVTHLLGKKYPATDKGLFSLCDIMNEFIIRNSVSVCRDPLLIQAGIFILRLVHNAIGSNKERARLYKATALWVLPVDFDHPDIEVFDGCITFPHVLYPTLAPDSQMVDRYCLPFPRKRNVEDAAPHPSPIKDPYIWIAYYAVDLAETLAALTDPNDLSNASKEIHRLFSEFGYWLSVRPHLVAYDATICRLALTCSVLFDKIPDNWKYADYAAIWRFPVNVSNPNLWDPPLHMDFFIDLQSIKPKIQANFDPSWPYATSVRPPPLSQKQLLKGPYAASPIAGNPALPFGKPYEYNILELPEGNIRIFEEWLQQKNATLPPITSSTTSKGKSRAAVPNEIINIESDTEDPRVCVVEDDGDPAYVDIDEIVPQGTKRKACITDHNPSPTKSRREGSRKFQRFVMSHIQVPRAPYCFSRESTVAASDVADPVPSASQKTPSSPYSLRPSKTMSAHLEAKSKAKAGDKSKGKPSVSKPKISQLRRLPQMPTKARIQFDDTLTEADQVRFDAYAKLNDFSTFKRLEKTPGYLTAADLKRPGIIEVSTICNRCLGLSEHGFPECTYRGPGLACVQCIGVSANLCSFQYSGEGFQLFLDEQLDPYIKASGKFFVDAVNDARHFEKLRLNAGATYNDLHRSTETAWLRVAELAQNFYKSFPPSVYASVFESPEVLFDIIKLNPEEAINTLVTTFSKLDLNQLTSIPDLVNGRRTDSGQFQEGSSRDRATGPTNKDAEEDD